MSEKIIGRSNDRIWIIARVVVVLAGFLVSAVSIVRLLGRSPEPTFRIALPTNLSGDVLTTQIRQYVQNGRRLENPKGDKCSPLPERLALWDSAPTVEITRFGRSELFERARASVGDPVPPSYDLMLIDDPWLPALLEHKDRLLPISLTPDDFPEALQRVSFEADSGNRQKAYAAPYSGNVQMLAYREDGTPDLKTWDGVQRYVEQQQTMRSGDPEFYPMVLRGQPGNATVTDFLPLLWSKAPEVLSSKADFGDGKQLLDAIHLYRTLARPTLQRKSYFPPGFAFFNDVEVAGSLIREKAALGIIWAAWAMELSNTQQERVQLSPAVKFTVAPGGHPPMGAWLLVIPAKAKNSAEAARFVQWVTRKELAVCAALLGNPPARMSVFGDESFQRKYPYWKEQMTALQFARERYRSPRWIDLESIYSDLLVQATFAADDLTINQDLIPGAAKRIAQISR